MFAIFTRVSITGTSVNTPTVVASAAGLDVPNKATATATANSKKFDAPIIPAEAAISYGSLIILHTPNARSDDTVFDEFMDTCEEVQKADSITQKQMLTYSKLFQMNFTKMDPYEFKTFMDIVERYSTAFKSAKGNGRGKKKRKLRFTACMDSRPRLRKA